MKKQFLLLLLLILFSGLVGFRPVEAAGVCFGKVQAADDYTVEDLSNYDRLGIPPDEEIPSVMEENDAKLFFEEAVMENLAAEEADSVAGGLTDAVGGLFIGILGSIEGIVDAFSNPNATALDKAAAILAWVPVIGEILGFIDMGIHEQQQEEARAKVNATAEHLNHITHYETLANEAADINQLLNIARQAFAQEKLDSILAPSLRTMTNNAYTDYRKRVRKAAWSLDHLYASKIAEAGVPSADNNNAPELNLNRMRTMIGLLFEEGAASDVFHSTYFEELLQGSLLAGDITAEDICRNGFLYGSDNRYKCGNLLLDQYAVKLKELALTGTGKFHELMKEYVQARNYILIRVKAHAINNLTKAASAVYYEQYSHYKKSTSLSIKHKFQDALRNVAEKDFFTTNNIDSLGRSTNSACWKTEKYNCLSGIEYCKKSYAGKPDILPWCYNFAASTRQYCDTRRVYTCETVTYNPHYDSQLQAALSELKRIYHAMLKAQWRFHYSKLDLSAFSEEKVFIDPFAFGEFINTATGSSNSYSTTSSGSGDTVVVSYGGTGPSYSTTSDGSGAPSVDGIYLGTVTPTGDYSGNVTPEDLTPIERLVNQAVELASNKTESK